MSDTSGSSSDDFPGAEEFIAQRAAKEEEAAQSAYDEQERRRLKARKKAQEAEREEEAKENGRLKDRILTYTELKNLPRPDPLIPDVLYTGSVALVLGNSQVGKTWVMLSICAAAAYGMHWPLDTYGGPPPEPMAVLYIAAEDGGTLGARLECWEVAHNRELGNTQFHAHPGAINLLNTFEVLDLIEVVKERKYRLVVVDTLASSLGGEEETNHAFSKIIKHMRMVAAAMAEHGGGSVVIVHHFGKDASKGARGGSSLFNDSDIVWELQGDMDAIFMKNTKWKMDSIRPTLHLRLDRSEHDAAHIVASNGPSRSHEDHTYRHEVLTEKIVEYVRENQHLHQGYGPSTRMIIGGLEEKGVKIRTQEVTNRLAAMEADRRLLTKSGKRNATYYRLPPIQDEL